MTAVTADSIIESAEFGLVDTDMILDPALNPNDLKYMLVVTPNTAQASSTMTVDLWRQGGIKRLLGVRGWRHTTEDSVIVRETPTTAVVNGILTITLGSTGNSQKRAFLISGG